MKMRDYELNDEDAENSAFNGNGGTPIIDPTPKPLPLTFFADLTESPLRKPWLIKDVLARDETSSWIGPPGSGKSALADDIAVHAAGGKDWRGHRTKTRSGVLIFALERADLHRRRLTA